MIENPGNHALGDCGHPGNYVGYFVGRGNSASGYCGKLRNTS